MTEIRVPASWNYRWAGIQRPLWLRYLAGCAVGCWRADGGAMGHGTMAPDVSSSAGGAGGGFELPEPEGVPLEGGAVCRGDVSIMPS